ncbi:MAG: 3-hydroxyacyl-CoA dehydrogenase/enoyl-CoA hydratase family protein, partial [Anaerolineae bacterium]|nr:3-hydroxyacyl-CoA dehydrogenase/enoyl-CoA hydratase family protein [Anaerolineae bacterium]
MSQKIKSVAVIGAGTMGAGIAAHVANAGIPATLLDIVPTSLTPEEEAKGLTLESPQVRNRLVTAGFERARKARPASFMSKAAEQLVTLGNVEDDFDKIAQADWVVEVIIEKLEAKQAMMARIEATAKPEAIITTNTSGLPIASIAEGRSDAFKKRFLGTHFFNPPRYLKLLEIIPTPDTDPEIVKTIAAFGEDTLGKGVVFCKDTPNFIGNRLFSMGNSFAVNYALENGYNVTEVDTLTGPLLGRPKTATIRLLDLVGVDIAAFVAHNLYDLIPHDPYREVLHSPKLDALFEKMLAEQRLGNKTGQGFYKKGQDAEGNRVFMTLNLDTFEYEIPENAHFESVGAVRKIEDLGRRIKGLLDDKWQEDRGAKFVRDVLSYELAYAAHVTPEIAHTLKSVDDAIRWGFAWETGPFQLWDMLGVAEMTEVIEAAGYTVAPWVKEMLAVGITSFYQVDNGRVVGYYDWDSKGYAPLAANPKHIKVDDLRNSGQEIAKNDSASLHDMGDGVLLLEFHAKMNAIDDDMVKMMLRARQMLETDDRWIGMVVGNDGLNFCVGANIFMIGMAAQNKLFDEIDTWLKNVQDTLLAFHYSPKPVVVAVHQRALGGGAEVVFGSSRVVAHAESYIGLVEVGVGVIPAGGGVTTLVRRIIADGMKVQHADPLPLAQKVFETIGLAKVSTSAAEAKELGFLGPNDRIVMNRDNLLYEAKQEVLSMVAGGYAPEAPAQMYAGGRDLKAAIKMGVWMMQQSNFISEHDQFIGNQLANIIAGGDLSG